MIRTYAEVSFQLFYISFELKNLDYTSFLKISPFPQLHCPSDEKE